MRSTMQFVALGQNVQLTATIPKKFSNYSNADLALKLNHGSTTESLLSTTVSLTNGSGSHDWTSRGLATKELSAIVEVKWTGRGMFKKTVTQQLFVYRTEVELYAVDADGTPVQNAAYELTITPHPSYTGAVAAVPTTGQTNGNGVATISNLPPLASLEVRWKNPNLLSDTGWVSSGVFTEDGAKRKAVLRSGYRAQAVGVLAGASLTRYVNIPLSVDDETAGPLVTIKAKVHPSDNDGGRRGDKIWARMTWAGTNCTRTDKTPVFEGQNLVELTNSGETKHIAYKSLGSDRAEVTFSFDAGVAGGDRFELWLGGDEHAEDFGPIEIVTKRKLKLIPHFPAGWAYSDRLFSDAFRLKLTRALEAAEIELEIADNQDMVFAEHKGPPTRYVPPREVSAEVSERIGWEREKHYVYEHSLYYSPIPDTFRAIADYPTIRAFFTDDALTFDDSGRPFSIEGMTSRTSDWISSGGGATGFFPCDFDGESVLTLFQKAEPERREYRFVYLWDEDAQDFVCANQTKLKKTHAWAVDDTNEITATCPWSGTQYPAYKGKLMLIAQAQSSGRTVVLLNSSGLPSGYHYDGPGYGVRTLVRTIPRVPEAWGEWRTADGRHGRITMDHIEIDMEPPNRYMRFRFQLPDEANPGPDNQASASVGLRTVSGGTAGESKGAAIILFNREGHPTDAIAHALLHEIGHSLEQSWAEGDPLPGIEYERKYLYGSSSRSVTNRGHQGPHCAYGLDDQYLVNTQNYSNLLANQGLHGTCLMFGGIGRGFVHSDETRKFCRHCMPLIKAQDLSSVGGPRK